MPFSPLGLFGGGGGALVAPFQGWRMFCCGSPGAMPLAGIGCSFGASGGSGAWVWVRRPFRAKEYVVMGHLGRCPICVNLGIIIFLSIEPSACTIPG